MKGSIKYLATIFIIFISIPPCLGLDFKLTTTVNLNGNPAYAHMAQLDNDTMMEVVCPPTQAGLVRAFDHDGTLLWTFQTGWYGNIDVADVNGDGFSEIGVLSADRHFYYLDHNGNQLWSYTIRELGLGKPRFCQLDLDSDLEVICGEWDSNVYSANTAYVYAFDPEQKSLLWEHSLPDDCVPVAKDLDGDSMDEVIIGTRVEPTNNPRIVLLDHNGTLQWDIAANLSPWDYMDAYDYNGDGYLDVVVSDAGATYGPKILNYHDGTLLRSTSSYGSLCGLGIFHGAVVRLFTKISDTFYCLDENLSMLWSFPMPSNNTNPLCRILDINGDQINEILVAGTSGEQFLFLDEFGTELFKGQFPSGHSGQPRLPMNSGDFSGDGVLDLVMGDGTSHLYYYEQTTQQSNIFFTDVYSSSNLLHNYTTESASLQDYDGDGDVDILIGARLWRNDRGFYFSEITEQAGLDSIYDGHGYWADIDNDGFMDIAVELPGDSRLYHNQGDGTFKDITASAGFNCAGARTASWIDYDNDGDVDFFVFPNEYPASTRSYLLRNNGNLTFTDVTQQSGLYISSNSISDCAFFDYDNDGDDDVLLTFFWEGSRFYKNNGDGTFTDVTSTIGFSMDRTEGIAVGDFNNDGYLDLFVNIYVDTYARLFLNNPDGTFRDVTQSANIVGPTGFCGVGCNFVDVDNDGWLDIYVNIYDTHDYLWHNNGDGTFSDISNTSGIALVTKDRTRDCVTADFNGDGKVDILITPSTWIDYYHLFKNESSVGHWLYINLIGNGTTVNRNAIGCKAKVIAGDIRQFKEVLGNASIASQNDFRLEFGLGEATVVDSIIVYWNDGTMKRLFNIEADQILTILQGEEYPEDGLVAYYPFNGNANDESGNGNHGNVNGPILAMDRFGNDNAAFLFQTEDNYIQVPHSELFNTITGELTLAAWVNVDNSVTFENGLGGHLRPHVLSKGATLGNLYSDFSIQLYDLTEWGTGSQGKGFLQFEGTKTYKNPKYVWSKDFVSKSEWHFLAATFDCGHVKLYIDGLLSRDSTLDITSLRTSTQPLYIGHRYIEENSGRFIGAIDDIRIYNRALTEEDIKTLYGEVTSLDKEKLNNTPKGFILSQNYPNPFNPETNITYQVSKNSLVKIEVYNLLGQRIRSLVNEEKSPGTYQVNWNGLDDQGKSVVSGIYLYRMQSQNFSQMRWMILLR